MSNIQENLKKILSAVWGKDVRQAIHDSIHDCYEDGKAGTTDLIAREKIDNLIAEKAEKSEVSEEKSERIAADAKEKSERQKEIATERARIDQLTKMEEGSTTGDAELIDIRVPASGFNEGKAYPTAGDAVREQVKTLSDELSETSIYSDIAAKLIWKDGVFVSGDGVEVQLAGTITSEPFEIPAGTKIKYKGRGYLKNIAMISKYKNGKYIPLIGSQSSEIQEYTYTTDETAKYAFSGYKGSVKYIKGTIVVTDYIPGRIDPIIKENNTQYGLKKDIEISVNAVNNKYIAFNGSVVDLDGYFISDVITLAPNTKLTFKGYGYEKNVAMISQKIGNSYKPLVVSRSSNLEEYVYSSENTINVVLSGTNIKYSSANLSLNVLDSVSKVGANIDKLDPSRNVNDYFSLSLFSKFGVIGDSYASGEVYNLEGKPLDNYSISWGQIMARKNGTQCVNFSEGGLTTRSWLKSSRGLSLLKSTEPLDAYYLALGINDFLSLKEPYLGTIADIEKQSDTFYGNYGKIINAIKARAPKAKIIMFTTAFDYADSPKFNNAIIEIANYFKIPYVVQLSDPFFTSDFYLKMQHYGHPVAICYSGMANAFERLICKCIADNQKYFMFMYTAD